MTMHNFTDILTKRNSGKYFLRCNTSLAANKTVRSWKKDSSESLSLFDVVTVLTPVNLTRTGRLQSQLVTAQCKPQSPQ